MSAVEWAMILNIIVLVACSLNILGVGFWGLAQKRPLVFSARQSFWQMVILTDIPLLIWFFIPLLGLPRDSDLDKWFLAIFMIMPIFGIIVAVWFTYLWWHLTRGYMILGVSEDAFHILLTNALSKLNLPFQETLSQDKLIGLDTYLQAKVTPRMGTAQFWIKQRQYTSVE